MNRFATFLASTGSTALLLLACTEVTSAPATGTVPVGETVSIFTDEAELDALAERMLERERRNRRRDGNTDYTMAPPSPPPPPVIAMEAVADAAAEPANAGITNTQEAGVDEGGIVKNVGDYLVILRRGRLFTVRVGGDALEPVDAIDAFPPGKLDPGSTWYDEMLVRGSEVIVIGYSYGEGGTEINRFRVATDGALTWRDTHYLRSGDYYSSSNYASRLIGDELVFYTPLPMNWGAWRDSLPSLRRRRDNGSLGEPVPLAGPRDIHIANVHRDTGGAPDVLHVVTRCNLAAEELTCEADGVLGSWSREFYVAREAIYVWTGDYRPWWARSDELTLPGQLFRIPLDGAPPGAVSVSGGPIDQFSFSEDAQGGVLRVVLRGESQGSAMWASEFTSGEVGLLTVSLAAFVEGDGRLGSDALRELPAVDGWSFQNRFVGRQLLYAASNWDAAKQRNLLHVVPLDGGEVTTLRLPHSVSRLDVLGRDAVAIGMDARQALGFSAIGLEGTPQVQSVYLLPAAGEGESRSQAFFYRADPGTNGDSGTLGLPVRRAPRAGAPAFLGGASAIAFLRRDDRRLAAAGELVADGGRGQDDGCRASCVDWYGNARPIFLGDRVFALMGYEIVEGSAPAPGGTISERRRIDYSQAIDRQR